ncbi:MAG TPA: serine--tRNA ligase [Anaerolineae bacterium]|nr:serine--tRNA ligase [Anaerolineae bacterium]HMR64779.1 serine--tRNA ligase [Anaerolineae bacterium]
MLDLNYIRENSDEVKTRLGDLNAEAPIDDILRLDAQRRDLLKEVEALRQERNAGSKAIGQLMREGKKDEAEAQKQRMSEIGDRIGALDETLRQVEADLNDKLLYVPNMPLPEVPVGPDDSHNVVVREEGQKPTFDFTPKPHWELGEALGLIDFERGVKLSGSRFYVLKGLGARLQRALITLMLDVHTQQHGYTEIYPPFIVRAHCLTGTGNLPKFGENLYHDAEEDYWLIPTAEVPITNLYREEILEEAQLPIYHVGYTPCFRREKMSAGRDVRGIKRGHQFDKVEMVKFVTPETGRAELDKLLDNAEDICRMLKLPYRIVQMCTGDLSFVAAIKFDIELWAAGSEEWLEVSSCALFTDFQARRANIRYRPKDGGKTQYVYTINGSGLALPRLVIAIIENYQQADGSLVIPEALRPYMGGLEVIGP